MIFIQLLIFLLLCLCNGSLWDEEALTLDPEPVKRVTWGKDCDSASIFKSTVPLIIEGEFVDSMPVLQWRPEDFARAHPRSLTATEVRTEGMRVPYRTLTQRFKMSTITDAGRERVRLSMAKLMRSCGDGCARYYSSQLKSDHFAQQLLDAFPSSCFYHHVDHADDASPEENSTHLWVSTGGPTTVLHYDANHNFFLQVFGEKTFWLTSPAELRKLSLFPFLSELSRQCGVDNSEYAVEDYVFEALKTRNVTVKKVAVKAGTLLFLPPFWGHRVQHLSSPCVSVNAWSDANEVYWFDNELPQALLPFEEEWLAEKKAEAMRVWFEVLHERICPERKDFFEVLRDRYLMVPLPNVTCSRWSCVAPDDEAAVTEAERAKFERYAVVIVQRFLDIADPDVRELLLWNYMERTVDFMFNGNDCDLITFFQCDKNRE